MRTKTFKITMPLYYTQISSAEAGYSDIEIPGTACSRYFDGEKNGCAQLVSQDAVETVEILAGQVAVIIVDVWGSGTEGDLRCLTPEMEKLSAFIRQCRAHGVRIIHAPGDMVARNYSQYQKLREKVCEIFRQYPKTSKPEFMNWPPSDNQLARKMRELRMRSRPARMPGIIWKNINYCVDPAQDDYIISTYEELRYALWECKTELLIYTGCGLCECMLQRQTGINALVGIDNAAHESYASLSRTPVTVAVAGDCCNSGAVAGMTPGETAQAMLAYLRRKIAFELRSHEVKFSETC